MFNKKSILITGGTGSLGNALVKKIIEEYKPSRLIIFSRDEVKQLEMRKIFPEEKYKFMRYFLGDVRDALRVREALRGVDYVVHAAALKQVPSGEYNPIEIIKTNIYGAQNIIEGCIANNVKQTIALSGTFWYTHILIPYRYSTTSRCGGRQRSFNRNCVLRPVPVTRVHGLARTFVHY